MKKNILMFVVMLFAVLSMTSCMEYRYVYVPTAPSSTGVQQQRTAGVAVAGATYTVSGYITRVSYSGEIWIAASKPILGYPVPAQKFTGWDPGEYGGWVKSDDFVTLTVTADRQVVNFIDHTAAARIRQQQWRDAYGF